MAHNRDMRIPLLSPDSTVDNGWNVDQDDTPYLLYNPPDSNENVGDFNQSSSSGLLAYLGNSILSPSQTYQQQNNVIFDLQNDEPNPFNIAYVNYPNEVYKNQTRQGGMNRQRIGNGEMSFVLEFGSVEEKSNVSQIVVKVKRFREPDNFLKRVGEVPLEFDLSHVQETKILVKANLDSVYEHDGKLVYELERSLTNEFNMYYLIVEVIYKSGHVLKQNLNCFKIIGKKKETPKKVVGEKRTHADSTASNSSLESGNSVVTGVGSPSSMSSRVSEEGLIQAHQIVADHVKTKTLDIDGLRMGKTIETHKGDIGYHFPKKNKDQKFEEGEVVALVPGEDGDRNYVIEKLSCENAERAALKGVITRSHYLEAMIPRTNIPSETICMLGVVPVQVVGSVVTNEGLYASPNHPGCAISRHHLNLSDIKEATFIGHAFSSRKTDNESSIGFVQAGVSVLETAGKVLLDQKLRDVEDSFDVKIGKIQKSRKKTRKVVIICTCLALVLLLLLSILLWQLLTPGSAYRYYLCKLGRKTNPKESASYSFIPYSAPYSFQPANGILFDFDKLMKKTHHTSYKHLNITAFNITSVRYYLNVDRCAYGGTRATHDSVTGQKKVFGADVFAIDEKCFNVWYYDELTEWRKYNSASWKKFKNVNCNPPSKWKKLEPEDKDKVA